MTGGWFGRELEHSSWPPATVANLPETVIGQLLRPAIADVENTVPGLLRFGRYPSARDPEVIYLSTKSGSGAGIVPSWTDQPGAEELVANAVQESVIEALWAEGKSAVWPECPDHPRTHPLSPSSIGEVLMWVCPATDRVIAPVGKLGG